MSYAHFLICSFSTVEFGELFVCFRYKSVVGYMIRKHFISVHLLSLHSANKSFVKLRLILMRPNLAVFFLYFGSCFWCLKLTQNPWTMPDSSYLCSCPFMSYGLPNLTSRFAWVLSPFSCTTLTSVTSLSSGHCLSLFTDALLDCRAASFSLPTVAPPLTIWE